MTKAQKTLVECFRRLTKTQLARLHYHAEKRTPICCGERATRWVDGEAG